MRALCYVACCADAVAKGMIVVGEEGLGGNEGVGEGYVGLEDAEVEMCLWKAIIGGLSKGMVSAKGRGGGIAQRGCVCALRAICLRHGALFSAKKWQCIVEQSIRPALRKGIRGDRSGVKECFPRVPWKPTSAC